MKTLTVLGSTGSIGENTLRIAKSLPGEFKVVALAAHRNAKRVVEQAVEFGAGSIALFDEAAASEARAIAPAGIRVLSGPGGVAELASMSPATRGESHVAVCAIVGMAALRPVVAALNEGFDVAIATKEVLVSAGAIVCRLAEEKGARLLPIDSEHCAIFQSLQSLSRMPWCVRRRELADRPRSEDSVRRLILTASGGPFANRPELDFDEVTVAEALNHPNWKMGPKVTVDSASMMNKGLEIMEAKWLFNVPAERISVLVHPKSIVHSLVEFSDASIVAQFGVPDMRIAIQYALTWPERPQNDTLPRLDLAAAGPLEFSAPDEARFPALRIARECAAAGGDAPAIMSAANEVAVDAFLREKIRFSQIWRTVEAVIARHPGIAQNTLDDVLAADSWARDAATEEMAGNLK